LQQPVLQMQLLQATLQLQPAPKIHPQRLRQQPNRYGDWQM
jgi:hypothetical protein